MSPMTALAHGVTEPLDRDNVAAAAATTPSSKRPARMTPDPSNPDAHARSPPSATTNASSPFATRSLRYSTRQGGRAGKSPVTAAVVVDTVGKLLADVATLLYDALCILYSVDQGGWGPDEHEQLRVLQEALDEAKRDFQELGPLVHGQIYYENDRNSVSIEELRALREEFSLLLENFANWSRYGGPINPIWAKETADLRRKLHQAQCRAARRIFSFGQEASSRCLGAFLVRRKQRALTAATAPFPPRRSSQPLPSHRYRSIRRSTTSSSLDHYPTARDGLGASASQSHVPLQSPHTRSLDEDRSSQLRSQHVDEIVACNSVGRFERLGDHDVAFVCDFCSGFIVWEDLETMPSTTTLDDLEAAADDRDPETIAEPDGVASIRPGSPPALPFYSRPVPPLRRTTTADMAAQTNAAAAARASTPPWQATGFAATSHAEKRIVYAPIAIANHVAPSPGDWQARILCPFCGDCASAAATGAPDDSGASDGLDEDAAFAPPADEHGFDDLEALIEHLDWQHAPASSLTASFGLPLASNQGSCIVM